MTAQRFLAYPNAGKLILDEPGRWSGLLGRLEGKRLWITVEKLGRKRTLSQNARFHGVIVPATAEYSGCTNAEAKDGLKRLFLSKTVVLPNGEELDTVKETSKLSVEEMNQFMEECEAWLAQAGVILPERDVA